MAAPDTSTTGAVVTFNITSNGVALPESYGVISITVHKEANRIAYATIVLFDGDPSSQEFDISSSDNLVPGATINIAVAYGTDPDSIFTGIITKHSIKIRRSNSVLVIECRDAATKMTTVNHSKYYEDVTDSDIMEELIGNYGLTANVDSTDVNHDEIIQYNSTDWDFVLCRADANGMLVFNEDGQLTITSPSGGDSVVTATFGDNIIEFDAEIDNRLQPTGVTATSWDYTNQEMVDGVEANEPSLTNQGNLDASDLAGEVADGDIQLSCSAPVEQDELQSWADSKLMRHRLAKVRGRVTIQGTSDPSLGDVITLQGVGDRFNGDAIITGIRHTVEDGLWLTSIQFGIDPQWFANVFDVKTNDAKSLLPAIDGLHIGIVTQIDGDPDGEDRIQVTVPVIDPNGDGVWSRIATLDAGNNRGTFFRPEVQDEVIVGFINNDPRYSVVLGMLNSSSKPAPLTATSDNDQKGYVSRSNIQMIFDDGQKNWLLQTPGGNKVFVDDNGQQIALTDQNNNKITMDQNGIKMEDCNNNKITMDNNGISLESGNDLVLKATGDVKMDGVNITIKATAQMKAQGQAGGEVSSSANMVVKGAIVQIN